MQTSLARQGLPVALKTPAEMSAMLPGEVAKWAAVIKLAHVTGGSDSTRLKNFAALRQRMFSLSAGDREPVDDIDVLLRIDRHRAIIGAEHDAVGTEHLDRLAHMRRPEAHRVDVEELEILARQRLAFDVECSGMPSPPSR